MAAGDQVPLVLGPFQAASKYVSALPGVDLSEYRLDDRLTSRVNRATVLRSQLPTRPFTLRRVCGNSSLGDIGDPSTVFGPAGRDEEFSLFGVRDLLGMRKGNSSSCLIAKCN